MANDHPQHDVRQALVILSWTVVIAVLGFLMYWARVVFIPLALAIFLTFILAPFVAILQKRGCGRLPAVILVVGLATLFFAGSMLVVGSQLVGLAQSLPDHEENIKKKVESVKGWVSPDSESRLGKLASEVTESLSPPGATDESQMVVLKSQSKWTTAFSNYLSPAAEAAGQVAFTFILVVFMLLRREDLRNRMIRLVGHGRVTTTTKAVDETTRRLSRYLLVQFLLNVCFGLVIAGGLFLIGLRYEMKYALLWGFLAFLMRYVPYIGTWIGVVPPLLFALAANPTWAPPILVFSLFIGLELLCNNIFEPRLYGQSLGLSEVAQLVATAIWALLWGPIGMILAWPLTTCLLILGKYVPQWRFLNVLLGDEPVLEPRVAFYQRLAAHDSDEAAEIVAAQLKTRPADEVYDDLIVSALASARREANEGTLSDVDLKFVSTSVREIAEEIVEGAPSAATANLAGRAKALLVPAKDELDRAALELFARLFDAGQWEMEVTAVSTLASEIGERIAASQPATIVIGALPPGGRTHTRYLCKRLRAQFPTLKIIVGRWGGDEDAASDEQLKSAGADEVVESFAAARGLLSGWRAVFAAEPVSPASIRPSSTRVPQTGTVPA